jgi:isocitrate dehydrogenase
MFALRRGPARYGVRSYSTAKPKIFYTFTDEAPALATYALLPVFNRFADSAGVTFEQSDISVAARILAAFGLGKDNLAELGAVAKTPEGYIIKLPNVSASIPQLNDAIAELQKQGFKVPNYPQEPKNDEEKVIKSKYAKVLGSAVNPVLREGNSDRHAAAPVKQYAQKHPTALSPWSPDCKTHVSHMERGDFYGSEKSYISPSEGAVRIELVTPSGTQVLKAETKLKKDEVIDSSFLSAKELRAFYEKEFLAAKKEGIMVSLHLKATMMKVSDPIIFGHAVSVYYKSAFEKHAEVLKGLGVNPNNGLASVLEKIATLPADKRAAVEADFKAVYNERPGVAMVDAGKGITNFHVPSDVIVDASMPPMIRDSGKMWNKDDKLEDTKCLIPDRCYATQYQVIIDDCKKNGQFNVSTMGHVSNVGLMAQAAEEYGSHDKTFEIPTNGTVRVVDIASGKPLMEHNVEKGDIWRMCQTKDVAIKDWVKLAYTRAVASNSTAIFWLDPARAHDANIIKKVKEYSPLFEAEAKAKGIEVLIMTPQEACKKSLERARAGKDTISVTGNVLRDYNTDMFPILELGTSAKMLSIVPLLAGGGMYETGAGGSAPKHVQQFLKEGHLRWDSLGEYLAVGACLEDMGRKTNNQQTSLVGSTLNQAIGGVLDNRKSPSRKVMQADNRLTSFYICLYWAQAMAKHNPSFVALAKKLTEAEKQINDDLIKCQGSKVDIKGYYRPDPKTAEAAMRPSALYNSILSSN